MHMPPVSAQQFLARGWSTAGRLALRWLVLIAILLAIGYVTKFSGGFLAARRADLGRGHPGAADPRHGGAEPPDASVDVRPEQCPFRRFRRLQRSERLAGGAAHQASRTLHPGRRILRRSQPGAARRRSRGPAARRARRTVAIRQGTRGRGHLHRLADAPRPARAGPARRVARHDRIHLLRARRVRVRPDPVAHRRDPRCAGRGDVRDAVRGLPWRRQAVDGHRDHDAGAGRALALPAADSAAGEVELAGSGDLQAAALRARWPGDPRLQVPHHEGHRGRRSRSARRRATTTASRRSGGCCGATRSTNCPSSSMCWAAR